MNCRYFRLNLDAYLDNRLTPPQRRRLSSHLDSCPACYALYRERRNLRAELQAHLPRLGHDHRPNFAGVWAAVQADLPRPVSTVPMRASFAAAMLLLLIFVPFTMGHHDLPVTALPPTQPVPELQPTGTPEITVVLATEDVLLSTRESLLLPVSLPPTLPEPQDSERGTNGNNN